MGRPLRIVYEGAIYHVTVGGHSRSDLFLDDRDRRRLLERRAHDRSVRRLVHAVERECGKRIT